MPQLLYSRVPSTYAIRLKIPAQQALRGPALALALIAPAASQAQQLTWVPHGPGPITQGQVEGILDGEVVGAIHDVAPHPTDADTVYGAAVNGGIWKTEDATAASPSWQNLTDDQASLSIGAIEFDPTDASNETLVAGFGRFSSSAGRGGPRAGLIRTTDGGATWTSIDGGGTLVGLNVSGVAPRGGVIVLSADTADSLGNRGVWRRPSAAGAWTQISGAAGTGLPAGASFDLVGHSGDQDILYTNSGSAGIYGSDDQGATWTKRSDAGVDAALTAAGLSNVEIAVASTGAVFVGIVTGGRLSGLFRSDDGNAPWTALDVPTTTEAGVVVGIHPGSQGGTHFSIAADPTDDDIVYVGGDRQVRLDEVGAPGFWPNSIGAMNFTGRLFRVDAGQPAGNQATPLTHSGTASNSSPHADSRDMAFDAGGTLIEADDGGVYRRTNPRQSTGDWFSINGDIQNTEFYAAAWDPVSNIVAGGAQDTGSSEGIFPTNIRWLERHQADGGDVAVGGNGNANQSVRYMSSQNLGGFRRRTYNSANVLQSATLLTPLPASLVAQFITPIEVNSAAPTRIMVGAFDDLYESVDQGSTLVPLGVGVRMNRNPRHPIAYGTSDDVNALVAGSGSAIWIRSGAGALTQNAAYPGTMAISDIAVDPDDSSDIYVADSQAVRLSTNGGTSWTDVTGDLQTLNPGTIWSIAFIDEGGAGLGGGLDDDAIAVGTDGGVFVAEGPAFNDWEPFGEGFPNAPAVRLDYDRTDQILLAGSLGRGAWTLNLTEGPASDVMLVLDFSGSMLSPACAGCASKLDVLKDSAEIFAELWRAMATPDDRIGVNYFRTNIEEFLVGGDALLPVVSDVPNVVDDLRSETTTSGQLTAMGGGVQQAINRLTDTARPRNIVVFTDGMQNVDPSVARIDDSPPAGAFHLEIADTGASQSSNVAPTVPPTRLDTALDVTVNAIGVGATPSFVTTLSEMASETDGLLKVTTAPDEDLRQFFVEELVQVLRNSSPQLIDYIKSTLGFDGKDAQSFSVSTRSKQVTIKVSWGRRTPPFKISVQKDGRDVTGEAKVIEGRFYTILSFNHADIRFPLGGAWDVVVAGPETAPYELAALSDEPTFDYNFLVEPAVVPVGKEVKILLRTSLGNQPFRGPLEGKVTVELPSEELMELLFRTDWRRELDLDETPDGSPIVEHAFFHLLATEPDFAEKLRGESHELALEEAGDGAYVAAFDDIHLAGPYRATLELVAEDEEGGLITRTETRTFVAEPGPASANVSEVKIERRPVLGGLVTDYLISVRPRDQTGNFFGPGYAGDLQLNVAQRDVKVGRWQDRGDGTYRVQLRSPRTVQPEVSILLRGSTFFNQSL